MLAVPQENRIVDQGAHALLVHGWRVLYAIERRERNPRVKPV